MKFIDLHTHSNASDGSDSPAQVVAGARELGLAAIALTDHDTTSGLAEARAAGKELGVRVVPGIELSTSAPAGEIHILGLWVPEHNDQLAEFLSRQRAAREKRNKAMIAKLQSLGLDISIEEVAALAKGSIGRPHIAQILVQKGYVANIMEAFKKYLAMGAKAWLPKQNPQPEDACRLLDAIGATAVFAHPFLEGWSEDEVDKLTGSLAANGLKGLEVWHTEADAKRERTLLEIAGRYGLLPSGGSDYHGARKKGIELGVGSGSLAVPESVLLDLMARRRERDLPC